MRVLLLLLHEKRENFLHKLTFCELIFKYTREKMIQTNWMLMRCAWNVLSIVTFVIHIYNLFVSGAICSRATIRNAPHNQKGGEDPSKKTKKKNKKIRFKNDVPDRYSPVYIQVPCCYSYIRLRILLLEKIDGERRRATLSSLASIYILGSIISN